MTLAIWTVTYNFTPAGETTPTAYGVTMHPVADSAGEAVIYVLGDPFHTGGTCAVTGARIDGTDWINSDVPQAEVDASLIGVNATELATNGGN